MNKDELQKLINDLKNQLQETQEKLKKLDKYERFKPKEGETYFYVDNDTCVCNTAFDNSFISDCNKYKAYNCFETKEEAEREANKILIRRKLEDLARRLNGDKKIDWDNLGQPKYLIQYNAIKKCLTYMINYGYKNEGSVYCLDTNFIDEAIKEIGKQELIDYIKGE